MSSQVLSTTFEVVGNWVQCLVNYATRRESTTQRPSRLSSLPYELLIDIFAYLEWKDILRMRQTCRLLNQVSRERSVWLALLYRYYETKFARPFFLPKPLRLCSASDLENRITRWWRGLDGLMVSPVEVHRIEPAGFNDSTGFKGPIPGGRYFFQSHHDGRLGYIDPRQRNPEFVDLIPCPSFFRGLRNIIISTFVTIDVLSQQEYTSDQRPAPALCGQLFPSAFNIAVLRMIRLAPAHFEIWRITARIEGEDVVGYSATLLSSFIEDHDLIIRGPCALYGKNLAYSVLSPTKVVTIVDWTEIPQGAKDFPRSYIPVSESPDIDTIYLLPGNILLALNEDDDHSHFFAWNWVEDSTLLSTLPSSPAVKELPSCPPMAESSTLFGRLLPFGHPYITRNSIRLLLATDNGALGVILPIATSGRKQGKPAFQVVQLLDMADLELHTRFAWYGYNSGISFPNPHGLETSWDAFHYRWPDEDDNDDGPPMSVCSAFVPRPSFPFYHEHYMDESQATVVIFANSYEYNIEVYTIPS